MYVIHENTDELLGTKPITDLAGIVLVTNNLPGITDHLLGTTPSTGERKALMIYWVQNQSLMI